MDIRLREANMSDLDLTFEWAQDPVTRAVSFSRRPISFEEHCSWLRQKLSDPNSVVLIAETDRGRAVGLIRFDEGGIVGISVAKPYRGKGLSQAIILQGLAFLRHIEAFNDVEMLYAYIKMENAASVHAFEKAGFRRLGEHEVKGQLCWAYGYNWSEQTN